MKRNILRIKTSFSATKSPYVTTRTVVITTCPLLFPGEAPSYRRLSSAHFITPNVTWYKQERSAHSLFKSLI